MNQTMFCWKFFLVILLSTQLKGLMAQECIETLRSIALQESTVDDTSERRDYILCPNTTFVTGVIVSGTVPENDFPLNLMANMTIKCGESGERSNNCIITGGTGLIGSPNNVGNGGLIQILGVTFSDIYDSVFMMRGAGLLEVIDCAFLNSKSVPNIYLETVTSRRRLTSMGESDYKHLNFNTSIDLFNEVAGFRRKMQEYPSILKSVFRNCLFEGNEIGMQQVAMISIPSETSITTFNNCIFRNNDFMTDLSDRSFQSLIYNAGSIELADCCFLSNRALNLGQIVTLQFPPVIKNTYGTVDPDTRCGFVTYFPDARFGQSLVNSQCLEYDASECSDAALDGAVANPISSPPPSPSCISDLALILQRESLVINTMMRRHYILCPNTIFETALLEEEMGESPPVVIRPNSTIFCGSSGERSNNCVVTGGWGLSGTPSNFDDSADIGSVYIRGITFNEITNMVFFLGQFNGQVEVHDCAFLKSSAVPNIYIESSRPEHPRFLKQTKNDRPVQNTFMREMPMIKLMPPHHKLANHKKQRLLQQEPEALNITFSNCLFERNKFGSRDGLNFTLIYLPSPSQITTFQGCVFRNNDYGTQVVNLVTQTLIYNNGGALNLFNNCFIDNQVLFFGVVNSLGENAVTTVGNFGTEVDNSVCNFIGSFDTDPNGPLIEPTCVNYDSEICLSTDALQYPLQPAIRPSNAPSARPTSTQPSIVPTDTPSVDPTYLPTHSVSACLAVDEPCSKNGECCSRSCVVKSRLSRKFCRSMSMHSAKLGRGRGGEGGKQES
mmetsp:Transcript_24773/g.37396  ORF Transcript_24773/g.37396 Transcript_24773/m.37396 type:complete len:783 (-) Transcript_24773:924-3272(-)|eukprot:CAMPEP_0194209304 /NCGR_PEP_ID=MMETSP0156-20130528/7481_1 /TAXON_ID=33649 /ORGANISM="Thalassionema nitzschioides, Strain L26-B" /LENGTH=782 /DNA_ID=CAMNT_0038936455 /DNA_START=1 /DNA_END=2349 /DNA_ORIENTATION=-